MHSSRLGKGVKADGTVTSTTASTGTMRHGLDLGSGSPATGGGGRDGGRQQRRAGKGGGGGGDILER
jgi:hypothetical protein